MKNFCFFLTLFVSDSINVLAEVRLPAIIGSHMVLQQNSEVKIWGWCEPGEKINLKSDWDTTTYHTAGTGNAKWSLQIKTPAAGGPYKITINTIVLEDVMIGEVWVCSGQSNMQMNINWGLNYPEDVANATNKSIRFFHIPRMTADYPQDDTRGKWVVCNPEDMKLFSAVGYFFGKTLQESLTVPIGLINASWSGTAAEVWIPRELVENDSTLKRAASKFNPAPGWPVIISAAYNAMIYPLANYKIAGAIWYQGESNTTAWATYQSLFTNMIGAWRKTWQTNFPFYYVQIAPYAYTYGNKDIGAFLREAQTKSMTYPNTGMVVISDLVNDTANIHPKMKKEVGQRLANYALAQTYGKEGFVYKSAMYKSMKVEKDKIHIYFENAEKGLMSKGGEPTEFYIAGEDKIFMPAYAKIEDNSIIVWGKDVKKPVAVRFGFRNAALPNLFGKEGLPVNLFRTDDWEADTSTVKK